MSAVIAETSLPLEDRGLAFGDGVFETVLVRDGRPMLWEAHLSRLKRGCRHLGIPLPAMEAISELPGRLGEGQHVLKLIVTRGSGGRGYMPPSSPEPNWRWLSVPFTPRASCWWEGVRIRQCDWRLAIQPALAGIKHMNRLENVMARREWTDPAVAEGLLCDTHGDLVEATSMNVFWQREGRLETPCLDQAGVAGTLREALMTRHPIKEVHCPPDILGQAEAVWVGNSVQGLWPVIRLDDMTGEALHQWSLGPIHKPLQVTAHSLLGYPLPAVSGA